MSVALILSIAIVALVLTLGAGLVVFNIRQRRQIDALMTRLQEVEARLAFGDTTAVEEWPVGESGVSGVSVYSADVLAGCSSHVARLVSESTSPADLADQAVVGIYRRIEDLIRPSDLADEFFVSLRTLERGIGRSLDCTPSQLILTVKMREARRLIESGELRVGEVAHRLAFADAAHFSRRYRKFYRCSPSHHVAGRDRSAGAT